jgi:hypothetical protein
MEILQKIFNSEKIHLTASEKNFVKETFELLSIFSDKISDIILQKFEEILNLSKNKFDAGKNFFDFIYHIRYPISYKKIEQLKKYKKRYGFDFSWNLEFDEEKICEGLQKETLEEIKKIINTL